MDCTYCITVHFTHPLHTLFLPTDSETVGLASRTTIFIILYARDLTALCWLSNRMLIDTPIAPVAPIVKYDTVRFNLTPFNEGPFIGYGPEVDKAWDSIANDSMHLLQ